LREFVETQMVRLSHAGFTVESAFEADEAWIHADAEAIKQVLLNLISNAEKYSPDEKWIRVALHLEGDTAVLVVADHGVGIRPRDAIHIFEEFYRADDSLTSSVGGTGLGLTLSRRLIEDQRGQILYSPNVPKGSVFEVRLPLGLEGSNPDQEEGA
jgi:signal transduction histidine kinase